MKTIREIKITIYNTFDKTQRNIVKLIYSCFDQKRIFDLCCILLNPPEGIKNIGRFFQKIDQNELAGTGIRHSDIDGYNRYKIKSNNYFNYSFLEMKTDNCDNQFDNWYKNNVDKREMFEHIIDCNTKTLDKFVYALHNTSYWKNVKLSEIMIKKVYVKENLSDPKGKWVDTYNGMTYLDFLKSMKES